jgi:hypothetical protein
MPLSRLLERRRAAREKKMMNSLLPLVSAVHKFGVVSEYLFRNILFLKLVCTATAPINGVHDHETSCAIS